MMIICSSCNAKQFDGTIFCAECGASLAGTTVRRETTMSLGGSSVPGEARDAAHATPTIVAAPDPAANGAGPTISFVILNSGRQILLDAHSELLVGRKDEARGIVPDVELGAHGGHDAGVSRRHARIAAQNGGWCVEDLSSANGTFVNGQRVHPGTTIQINDGDEITFGTLILRFEAHT